MSPETCPVERNVALVRKAAKSRYRWVKGYGIEFDDLHNAVVAEVLFEYGRHWFRLADWYEDDPWGCLLTITDRVAKRLTRAEKKQGDILHKMSEAVEKLRKSHSDKMNQLDASESTQLANAP